MAWSRTAKIVYADGPVGSPAQPDKAEIRSLLKQYEDAIAALTQATGAVAAKATLAELNAVSAAEGDIGIVFTGDNSGVYARRSGVWVKQYDLPSDIAELAADAAEAAKFAAEAAKVAAQTSQSIAEIARDESEDARDAAQAAAEASGNKVFFDTYAAAAAAVAGLPALQVVEVFADETRVGRRAIYRKEGPALVFKAYGGASIEQGDLADTALQPDDKGFTTGKVLPIGSFEGLPAIVTPGQLVIAQEPVGVSDPPTFNFIRKRTVNGGPSGFTNSQIAATTYILAEGDVDSSEWPGTFGIENHSTGGVGQHTPLYTYMRRYGDSYSWSFCTEFQDKIANPTQGGIGVELGFFPVGPDNNNRRVALHLAFQRPLGFDSSAINEIAYGIWCNPNPNTQVKFGMRFEGKFGVGLDLSGQDTTYSPRAVNLAQGGYLAWVTSGTPVLEMTMNPDVRTLEINGAKRIVAGSGSGGTVGNVVDHIVLLLDGNQYALQLREYSYP